MKNFLTKALLIAFLTGIPVKTSYAVADDTSTKKEKEEKIPLISITPVAQMQLIKVGKIVKLVGEDRFQLDDGLIYILSNIRVPLKLQGPVKEYFNDKLIGQSVGIFISKDHTVKDVSDRYGQVSAQVMTSKGLWVQADLISKGLAYVYSIPKDREMVQTLYLYETTARENNFGIWAYKDYDIKTSETISKNLNSFQVYEGKVLDIKRSKARDAATVIKFSTKKDDLRVLTFKNDLVPLDRPWGKNYDLDNLTGYKIRVRGWVEDIEGPAIKLDHLEQIEVMDQ